MYLVINLILRLKYNASNNICGITTFPDDILIKNDSINLLYSVYTVIFIGESVTSLDTTYKIAWAFNSNFEFVMCLFIEYH